MEYDVFTPADILIPDGVSLEKWSVIACDQFSSEPEYWERVQKKAGDAPSALNMIIPEVYLSGIDEAAYINKISAEMERYINSGVFCEIKDSYIFVERTLPDGRIRRGIVGAIDLERYDFTGEHSDVRASEGTVLERLPVRKKIRAAACIELPHIITFIDDKDNTVMGQLADIADTLPVVYDFDLMEGGGHIIGKQVTGADAHSVKVAISKLGSSNAPVMVIGDGNHSLAGAKVYWDELKQGLDSSGRETHPARRALVEVCNVYDPAIDFEAIHRVLFGVNTVEFIKALGDAVPQGNDYTLRWAAKGENGTIGIKASCIGDMLEVIQSFIDSYLKAHPGTEVDYIHGEDAVAKLVQSRNSLGLVLPAMNKSDLFKTVTIKGVFPRKSFSVGHAKDKRYYLECRKIRKQP